MSLRENQMLQKIPQNKVDIFMVRDLKYFYWKNEFSPEYILVWDSWKIYKWEHIYWDLVYGFKMPQWVTHTFPSKISEITKDKTLIETLFPKYTFQSIICKTYEEIAENFDKITSNIKVLKPQFWAYGKWIFMSESLKDFSHFSEENFPYLLQDFLDTSSWFYTMFSWIHDYRVIILNGEIVAQSVRQPKSGDYLSNVSEGWNIHDISDFKIPNEILEIIQSVDEYCKKYEHRYYSIDMGRGRDRNIKIFEMNSAPWLTNNTISIELWNYIAKNILKVS
jgi:glutathione synthase/RimK-type ligase-like ATP-grasp enzyme